MDSRPPPAAALNILSANSLVSPFRLSSSFTLHFNNNSLTIDSRPPPQAVFNIFIANSLSSPSQPDSIFNARKDSGSLQTKASISKIQRYSSMVAS